MKAACLYLVLLLPPISLSSQAPDSTTAIAVYTIKSEVLSTEFASILSDYIEAVLLGIPHYRVIARSNLDVLIVEDNLYESGVIQNKSRTINSGTLSAIDKVCTGSVNRVGTNLNFTLKMIDVGTGRIDAAAQQIYCGSIDGLLGVADSLIRSICPLPPREQNVIDVRPPGLPDSIAATIQKDFIGLHTETIPQAPSGRVPCVPKEARPHRTVPPVKAIIPADPINNTRTTRSPSKLGRQISIGAAAIFGVTATLLLISKN